MSVGTFDAVHLTDRVGKRGVGGWCPARAAPGRSGLGGEDDVIGGARERAAARSRPGAELPARRRLLTHS